MGKVLVDVLMPAYNHGKYIAQAIESFLAQENIAARLLIGNDASTDDTLSIAQKYAKQYPDKISILTHLQNQGLIGNYKLLLEHSTAPYVAILESDDFWTDPLKLSKQVAYMEANPNCGLVYTSGQFTDEQGNPLGIKQEKEGARKRYAGAQHGGKIQQAGGQQELAAEAVARSEVSGYYNTLLEQTLYANPVLAVTACFRRSAFDASCNMVDFVEQKFVTFDYPVWLGLAAVSDFYAMADVTACYRVSGSSISNNASYTKREEFMNGIDSIVNYTIERFNYSGNVTALRNERCVKHMILALAFNKFERYSYFCKEIDPKAGIRWAILRYFPWLFKLKKRKLIGTGALSATALPGQ